MKTGLILEGGAMRGMFTCGILDIFMENDVVFDGVIGVSAGAAFGINYKSRQIGRAIRYNKRFCRDPRYVGLRSLLKTGDLYGADFDWNVLPNQLDIFDVETYRTNPMAFYAVCTDADTGQAIYHRCDTGDAHDLTWLRASASMPVVSRLVEVDGYRLTDGGVAASIPVRHFQSMGYDRNVVVLTQPRDYRKTPSRLQPLIRLALRKTPALARLLDERPAQYNETLDYIIREEAAGRLLVLSPEEPLNIGSVEKNPDELERVYQLGRTVGLARLAEVKDYLARPLPR